MCACISSHIGCLLLFCFDFEPFSVTDMSCIAGSIPDGGKPVGQRNNQFDDLLINNDGADERAITGLRTLLTL